MKRREFLGGAAAVGLTTILADKVLAEKTGPFKLNYAPHFGMFRHHAGDDPFDQLKFIAEQGFRALEDNGMMDREVDLQNKIAAEMTRLDLKMGVFVAHAEFSSQTFVRPPSMIRENLEKRIRQAVEVAKRVNAQWCTVVPGAFDPGMEWEYQTANVIENLKYCAGICEPAGLIMVLEPLNPWRDHPGLFLSRIPQAYQICEAVGSPSCKILDDLYHQQITEGNLIPNIDRAWTEIAYFQVGDNPGRNEPTTGEINFRNIFRHLHQKGYEGIIGMEHGKSADGIEGEKALLTAYRTVDNF
jgi:hydroxypyruvate isomerase